MVKATIFMSQTEIAWLKSSCFIGRMWRRPNTKTDDGVRLAGFFHNVEKALWSV